MALAIAEEVVARKAASLLKKGSRGISASLSDRVGDRNSAASDGGRLGKGAEWVETDKKAEWRRSVCSAWSVRSVWSV
jgi:hypothetical protein